MMIDACVAQHQGDRKEQQDRVALLPHPKGGGMALAVLADGMGGHTGGALAAQQVLHTAAANFEQFPVSGELAGEWLEQSIHEAHTLIRASRFINEKDPHSTVVMLLLQPKKASWAHCGDSRLYHFRGERLLFRTKDHSYVEDLVAQGKLRPDQAQAHPYHHILLSTLGSNESPQVDVGETSDLRAGDTFVLCSDGLWGYFSDAELGAAVAARSARQASDLLIGQARTHARGSGDNASLVVIKLVQGTGDRG
ncbi:MAG: protein phosphatase 2C domain-containing protein [Candidatus Accumulibacter sp.]|jgi:serine/threonine protein phosphatase PrpC|nr:protein phosphatase 2C domain-containing protein [Accumulibacter sp.]